MYSLRRKPLIRAGYVVVAASGAGLLCMALVGHTLLDSGNGSSPAPRQFISDNSSLPIKAGQQVFMKFARGKGARNVDIVFLKDTKQGEEIDSLKIILPPNKTSLEVALPRGVTSYLTKNKQHRIVMAAKSKGVSLTATLRRLAGRDIPACVQVSDDDGDGSVNSANPLPVAVVATGHDNVSRPLKLELVDRSTGVTTLATGLTIQADKLATNYTISSAVLANHKGHNVAVRATVNNDSSTTTESYPDTFVQP